MTLIRQDFHGFSLDNLRLSSVEAASPAGGVSTATRTRAKLATIHAPLA